MPEFSAFRGLLYDTDRIPNWADVISPPFDVISSEEQGMFHQRSPYNVVRLVLGQAAPQDTVQDNPHTRAAIYLDKWRRENILKQDQQPALYLTALDFTHDNHSYTRWGLVGLVRLEPFEKGLILPHERTFTKVKSERLALMKHCHSNFSPIFSVYDDGDRTVAGVIETVAQQTPDVQFADHGGFGHRLWRIASQNLIDTVSAAVQAKKLFIADGHHRYETALNYRNWVAENDSQFDSSHPANFVMMYLTRIQDPGLLILPAHRLLKDVSHAARESFNRNAAVFFDIQTFPIRTDPDGGNLHSFLQRLRNEAERHAIGVYFRGDPELKLMCLKPDLLNRRLASVKSPALYRMDVNILTEIVFLEILGFDRERLDDETRIGYTVRAAEAIQNVDQGRFDAAFLLNPTTVEQVCQAAEEGQVMPRKATYFYPKVTTGIVMNLLLKD